MKILTGKGLLPCTSGKITQESKNKVYWIGLTGLHSFKLP